MTSDNFNQYWNTIEQAAVNGLPKSVDHRLKTILNDTQLIFDTGVQFFVPVHLNTKVMARPNMRDIPLWWATVRSMSFIRHPKRADGKRGQRLYDWAVRTGKWNMLTRDKNWIFIIFDTDNFNRLPDEIKEILAQYPTLVIQTRRGFHFYFYAPAWCCKSGSNPGCADWLARGQIAVVTGADRRLLSSLPIATLDPADAKRLHEFATQPPEKTPFHPYQMGEFKAVQGERNFRLNAELYRLRHLSNDQTEKLSQQLAAQCDPPYPPKEAQAIAKSINRYKYRFPATSHSPIQPQANTFTGDIAYTRLGNAYPKAGMTFTRLDYEGRLLRQGWPKRKYLGAAKHDIQAQVRAGEIEVVGKGKVGPKGGRPPNLYRRTRDYTGSREMLMPGKPTARHIRLSAMMHHLPDDETPISRDYLRVRLGLRDVGTISRYSNFLRDENLWGQALIEKREQPPDIQTWMLLPDHLKQVGRLPHGLFQALWQEFVRYQPSRYHRLTYYRESMFQGRFAALAARLEQNIQRQAEVQRQQAAQDKQTRLEKLLRDSSPKEQWELLNGLKSIEERSRRLTSLALKKQTIKNDSGQRTIPCINVANLSKTPSQLNEMGWQQTHQRLPDPEKPPPESVDWHALAELYDENEPINSTLAEAEVAPIPEDQLPGYPLNFYLGGGQPMFDYVEECYLRKDISHRDFHQRCLPEWIAAWEQSYFKDIRCPRCGQGKRVHHTEAAPKVCAGCRLRQAKQTPLPEEAQTVLARYETSRLDYLWALFKQTFGKTPRTKKEVQAALDQYGWQWVEYAMLTVAEQAQVRYAWPTVIGTLRNWEQQGYVNSKARHRIFEARLRTILAAHNWRMSDLAYLESVFEAYDGLVDYLTEAVAYLIAEAVRVYGERPVRHAIYEAARYGVHQWTYCEKILERLQQQDKLKEV